MQPKTIGCQCENGDLLKIGTLEVDNNTLSPYGWWVHFVHVINNCKVNLNQNVHNFLYIATRRTPKYIRCLLQLVLAITLS